MSRRILWTCVWPFGFQPPPRPQSKLWGRGGGDWVLPPLPLPLHLALQREHGRRSRTSRDRLVGSGCVRYQLYPPGFTLWPGDAEELGVLASEPPRRNPAAWEQRRGGAGFSVGGRRPAHRAFKATSRAGPGAESRCGREGERICGPELGAGTEDRRPDSAGVPDCWGQVRWAPVGVGRRGGWWCSFRKEYPRAPPMAPWPTLYFRVRTA